MDTLTPEQRSRLMASVKCRDTKPELIVRSLIHRAGYRFRLHCRNLPGCPDVVLPRHGKIVLVHGCFWHRHRGCGLASVPKSRVLYWNEKFEANMRRDKRTRRKLKALGWSVMVVWECETRKPAKLLARLERFLDDEG